MAKQPDIETILDGSFNKHRLNQNFKAIAEKFDEALSRDTTTDTPNFMETDLDVADATITNTNSLEVQSFTVAGSAWTGFGEEYLYKLGLLTCPAEGHMITHTADGDPTCLAPGANDLVLKSNGTTLVYQPDIDTDVDTVGVTVQEDGVTVATNVTTIDFLWSSSTLVTTPNSAQVDLDLDELLGPLWEDTNQNDTNLDPSASTIFNNVGEVTRVDLLGTVGLSAVPTADNQYYVILECSNDFDQNPGSTPANGVWTAGVRFYDSTGTATSLSGSQVSTPAGETDDRQGNTDGGNLITVYCGIPADTQYIDFAWSLIPTFPLSLNSTQFSDRYRAVVPASLRDTVQSPNSIAYPGGVNTEVT